MALLARLIWDCHIPQRLNRRRTKQRSEMKYGKADERSPHQLVMLPWYSVFDNLAYKVRATR